jgi:cysteine-rich repeat protein
MRLPWVLCLWVLASSCHIATGLDDFTVERGGASAGGGGNGGVGGSDGGGGSGGMACGDGVRDEDEECDDGNRMENDGCSSACVVACPDGWTKADNLHCYVAADGGMSWMEALAFCPGVDVGAYPSVPYLATITTAQEQAIGDDMTAQGESRWLGASDIDTEGTWTWENGEPWEWPLNVQPPWASPQEPNDDNGEDCLEIYDTGLFNDATCEAIIVPLCELDPPGP